MDMLKDFCHIGIVCSDYEKALDFYVNCLGMKIYRLSYSFSKNAKKVELLFNDKYLIELFTTEKSHKRERDDLAVGCNHIAFYVDNIDNVFDKIKQSGYDYTQIKLDMVTGKKYMFIFDPDGFKIELYET